MRAFIKKAGKYTRVGGIVVQALTLVLTITEHISNNHMDGVAKHEAQTDDPKDRE